ncbi:hypothetical protein SNOG_10337 [Parastagonospora nodorum SN15]|uniref:Septum-promoting GTP-binding protein 1 n=1 Tax=Phaeosphaeria nodorum (strain SN15 / ATCC MYA-4574 / FGSC 10173) TaxID=321614 RepID=Q0UD27_PHANO|nr:hypothetical protein SNOG_10337 [Parastagonospora nodorum SN15]EAT82672.2 hypothetical protein SNOG_10337 [Parastagonospora nodorum SN15]
MEMHPEHMVSEGHMQEAPPQIPSDGMQQQQQQHVLVEEVQPLPPPQPQLQPQQPMVAETQETQKHMDQTMDVDDSQNTTITASTVGPLPDFHPNNGAYAQNNNGYTPEPHRPSTSYSDTAYQYTTHNGSRFNTTLRRRHTATARLTTMAAKRHTWASRTRGRAPQMGRYPASDGGSRSNSYQDQNQRSAQQQQQQQPTPPEAANKNASVVIKVGMVGDAQIGKTSLMVKYVEGSWDEDYIQTLGVNFMEKTISIRNTEITFSIWDLGGQREFVNMLPLVCNDAVAILFMFDLTRKSTLNSIKEWYRQGRGFNKTAIPFLVGTNINVQKIFKIVLSKAFDLKCTIPEIENIGEPLLLYQAV